MKLFLIDGHALIFKMYYAFLGRPMVNSKGEDTSIIFGFTKYLLELIGREKPSHIAVAFDPSGGTFRNRLFPEYKANRSATPQLVIDSLKPLTEIVNALNIPVLMVRDFEADDVVGTVAKRFASDDVDVYMVTPDKDYGQLVSAHIYQYKPGKGGADNEVLGVPQICEKYKIASPSQVIDILALCGDSSDNVPGIQGVGPVGAAKLLAKFGSFENVFEHIDELSPKLQDSFTAAKDMSALVKELVTIRTDVPIELSLEDMALSIHLKPQILSFMEHYEMPSLRKMIVSNWDVEASSESVEKVPVFKMDYQEISPRQICEMASKKSCMGVLNDRDELVVSVENMVARGTPDLFSSVLKDKTISKRTYGAKSLMHFLDERGLVLVGRIEDVELMHYVLNPERNHSLEFMVKEFLGFDLEETHDNENQVLSLFDEIEEDPYQSYKRAVALYSLAPEVYLALDEMKSVYDDIEEPLCRVLFEMEKTGVLIDIDSLREFASGLRLRMLKRESEIREIAADQSLNVASPKQIGELLFEKLKIDPKMKKTVKGNWPTDEETLSALSHKNPVIDYILDYRGTRKLLSTYIEPIPDYVSARDGRVHTTFNQALTSTGRLSSSSPNLQNIPIRTDEGREIRRAFSAGEGNVIMSADYSQIELRIMAHCCGDEHMIEAFRNGEDVHRSMAAKIFHKDIHDVTDDDRRKAKTANFGIMYGISAFGLSQRLGVSRTESSKLIADYFDSFPSIKVFLDGVLEGARENGYVKTLFGRRRYVPDVNSRNGNVRAIAERNAINAPIQGSAADIIKLAMIGVSKELANRNLKAKMVLQIHDELMLEVPENEINEVRNLLVEQMEGVVKLAVPLTVECNYGKNWLEAH